MHLGKWPCETLRVLGLYHALRQGVGLHGKEGLTLADVANGDGMLLAPSTRRVGARANAGICRVLERLPITICCSSGRLDLRVQAGLDQYNVSIHDNFMVSGA